jgi:hypothetical protein
MVVVPPATALLIADVADDAAEGIADVADDAAEDITDVADDAAEDIADEAELAVSLDLFAWHPEPIKANPATAAVNATVLLVIARITFLSN